MTFARFLVVFICACSVVACSNSKKSGPMPASGGPYPCLLVAQAQFLYKNEAGKRVPVPGPAVLTIKQKIGSVWKDTFVEDPKSNVFHKAVIMSGNKKHSILTIGAMEAALKLWKVSGNRWEQNVLWNPVFGGKWDRLRDVEVGDVTHDGRYDLVIATHDQGIIAVAIQTDSGWRIKELNRTPEIFVHEVEIGDVDGDGKNEFFATPSFPNKSSGGAQPGEVLMFSWNGTDFIKTVVDRMEKTHAKEILACVLDKGNKATLFSVAEAETRKEGSSTVLVEPVKIIQYAFTNSSVTRTVVASINDYQCRFLTAGDVDGDGDTELVAAAMKSGLWVLNRTSAGWEPSLIDRESSGYEHAVCIDDLDGNGIPELYVASDDQHELRTYAWDGTRFEKTVLNSIPDNRITWNLSTGMF